MAAALACVGVGVLGLLAWGSASADRLARSPTPAALSRASATHVKGRGHASHAVLWVRRRAPTRAALDGASCVPSPFAGNFAPDWCWVVGQRGTILASRDNALRWRHQRSGTRVDLRGVFFVGAARGVAVGAAGVILQTADGGRRWRRVSTSPATRRQFNAVVCQPGGQRCWAVGSGVAAIGSISGTRWTLFAVAGTGGRCAQTTNACLNGVAIANTDEHYAAGGGGSIFAQFDYRAGGWAAQLHLGAGYFSAIACAPSLTGHGHCIAVGTASTGRALIALTFDSGSSWTRPRMPSASLAGLDGVAVLGPGPRSPAWAVGAGGLILRGRGGGRSWARERAPTRRNLEAVICPDNPSALRPRLVCLAVGAGGTILTRS